MVFTQIFVSYESVQYKRSAFTFLFNGSLYGKKFKISVTSAYIACATGRDFLSPRTTIFSGIESYPSASISCCSDDLTELLPCLDL